MHEPSSRVIWTHTCTYTCMYSCAHAYAHTCMHISYQLEIQGLKLYLQSFSEPRIQRGGSSPMQIQRPVSLASADAATAGVRTCLVGLRLMLGSGSQALQCARGFVLSGNIRLCQATTAFPAGHYLFLVQSSSS